MSAFDPFRWWNSSGHPKLGIKQKKDKLIIAKGGFHGRDRIVCVSVGRGTCTGTNNRTVRVRSNVYWPACNVRRPQKKCRSRSWGGLIELNQTHAWLHP